MNHQHEALKKKYEEMKSKKGSVQADDAVGLKDQEMAADEDAGDKVAGLAPDIGEHADAGHDMAHDLRDTEDSAPGGELMAGDPKDHLSDAADSETRLQEMHQGDAVSKHGMAPSFMKHQVGSQHHGRSAMSLHERAAGSMKEKMAALQKSRKKG